MLTEFWLPLFLFAAIAAFTPGPNNLMLAASGMNYGFRRTVPHIAGISVGFPMLLLCVIFAAGAGFSSRTREGSPAPLPRISRETA